MRTYLGIGNCVGQLVSVVLESVEAERIDSAAASWELKEGRSL
jgi:hypothetical protein